MSSDELRPVALELHILAGMLVKLGKHDLEQRLDSHGASIGSLSFGILRLLGHEERTIAELGRHMMITPATLVPAVDALEREGLVRRGQDPRDRRRNPLSITVLGADLLSRVPVVDKNDALVRSLEAMGSERAEELLLLMRDLVSRIWQDEHPDARYSVVESLRDSVRDQLGCAQRGESHSGGHAARQSQLIADR